MALNPVVRYMILCQDWGLDPENPLRLNVYGLVTTIQSLETPPYPLLYGDLCVLLMLTEGRGTGAGQIRCIYEGPAEMVFTSAVHPIRFGNDPLDVVGVPFRIQACRFPTAGLYSVQFWYNDERLAERPLRLR